MPNTETNAAKTTKNMSNSTQGDAPNSRAQASKILSLIPKDKKIVQNIKNMNICSAMQFDKETILQLLRLAAAIELNPSVMANALEGKILISAFFEPSTRTRLSFESSWYRLGGKVISITDCSTTGLAKGESFQDIAEMFNNYGDCVVVRSGSPKTLYDMMEQLRVPIVNAGNGQDEHPTQALIDFYTILSWRPELILADTPNIKICIIGLPSLMRTVRSLLNLLCCFTSAVEEVVIVHEECVENVFSSGHREWLRSKGLNLRTSSNLAAELPGSDVVYINAITWLHDGYEITGKGLRLDTHSPLKSGAMVMHPLARGRELDVSLDTSPYNWYFPQARNATFVRMALLSCLMKSCHHPLNADLFHPH